MLLNKKKRIHYLGFDDFWFVIAGIIILSFVTDYIFTNSFFKHSFGEAIINWSVSLFFSTCYWLIVRPTIILLRKKYPALQDVMKRVVIMIGALLITVFLVDYLGNILLNYVFFNVEGAHYNPIERSQVLVPIFIICVMVLAMYEAVYFYTKLKASIREEEQAKQAIVEAQLDALRNQAQPHFFFNSLNTLRDIIDQNPKEDAKEFVDKLADVYRFILDSGNVNRISLRDELKFARAYIHIQSERFGTNLNVSWNIPELLLEELIVPMSLQILLENAIKHNIVSKAKPLHIQVSIEDQQLVISNNLQLKSTQLPSTKLGLKNIEKRYALMSDQSVIIQNNGDQFIVKLPLLKQPKQYLDNEDINY